jgi:L-amino acid N-acyltransferase YncA
MATRVEVESTSIYIDVHIAGGRADAMVDAKRVTLRDGSTVVIRPLVAGDEAAIASWFAGLGAETRYARFFAWLERLDRWTQSALARVDHFDHEAVAAVAADGTTVGIARYIRTATPGVAEVAVAVADACRGKGIASLLLERIATSARAAGIERFIAVCLATNHTVIRLLSRLGPTSIGPSDAGVVELRIDLTGTNRPEPSTGAPTEHRRRRCRTERRCRTRPRSC